MSPTDASTHSKRKADTETEDSVQIHNSDSEKHESKRVRKDESTTVQHADDCEDADCEGCAEGEIVLQFETNPSAVELFEMAREEAVKPSSPSSASGPGPSRMAKALFDKAIEEFEVQDKAHSHIELNDGTEVAGTVVDFKIQHAACVVAVGNFMPSFEMLQEGTRMFEDLSKRTENKNGHVLVGWGIAEVSQVGCYCYVRCCATSLFLHVDRTPGSTVDRTPLKRTIQPDLFVFVLLIDNIG